MNWGFSNPSRKSSRRAGSKASSSESDRRKISTLLRSIPQPRDGDGSFVLACARKEPGRDNCNANKSRTINLVARARTLELAHFERDCINSIARRSSTSRLALMRERIFTRDSCACSLGNWHVFERLREEAEETCELFVNFQRRFRYFSLVFVLYFYALLIYG